MIHEDNLHAKRLIGNNEIDSMRKYVSSQKRENISPIPDLLNKHYENKNFNGNMVKKALQIDYSRIIIISYNDFLELLKKYTSCNIVISKNTWERIISEPKNSIYFKPAKNSYSIRQGLLGIFYENYLLTDFFLKDRKLKSDEVIILGKLYKVRR